MQETAKLIDDLASLLTRDDLPARVMTTLEAVAGKLDRVDRMEKMVDAFRGMLYVRDLTTGQLQYVSRGSARVFGATPEELIDRPSSALTDRLHPDDLQGLAAVAVQEMAPRAPFETSEGEFLFRVVLESGDTHWVREHWRIHRDANGNAIYAVGDIDIAESRPETKGGPTLREDETTALVASSLAHDFNNLLGAVLGNLDLVAHKLPDNSAVRQYLQLALTATERTVDLNQRLARLGRGDHHNKELVRLDGVIRETVAVLGSMLPAGVKIDTRLAAEPALVMGDGLHLRRALMNLVKNAVEAFDDGEGTVLLELRVGRDPSTLVLTVQDNGPGIDPEILDNIFDPFFTTKPNGHGLGLAVIRGILRGSGGDIEVQSQPGEGTSFVVTLPAAGSGKT